MGVEGGRTMKQKYPRECGGCTACCTTHGINELQKKPGKPCQFCNEGLGCKVYDHRPRGCREFACEWLKGAFAHEQRPDYCGLVFDLQVARGLPNGGKVLVVFEYLSGSLERFRSEGFIEETLAAGIFIIFRYLSGRGQFYAPMGRQISQEAFDHLAAKNAEVIYLPVPVNV